MNRVLRFSLAGLALAWATGSQATEVMRWERLPLSVPLVVGQERVIFVDRDVRVGLPAGLDGALRVQSAAGAVYLQAEEDIAASRLQLQDVATGELILLDVSATPAASKQATLEPIRIIRATASAIEHDRSATPAPGAIDLQVDGSTVVHTLDGPTRRGRAFLFFGGPS